MTYYIDELPLRCPDCRIGFLTIQETPLGTLDCSECSVSFPVSNGRPVLLRHDNSLFNISDYLSTPPLTFHQSVWARFTPTISVNLSVIRLMKHLRSLLDARGPSVILVVGGGRQRSWLNPLLCESVSHRIIYTDIDTTADVDIFCDGHDLPFDDNSIDALITTAVLEHVLYPERVAAEISRVVKFEGILYSEMPFMQQVHEGAYDFTRYTLSGHRRLFNSFSEIEVGMVAGPATALAWAIENFILAFFGSKKFRNATKVLTRFGLFWIKYFDYILIRRAGAMDGASCTYLFAKKIDGKVADSKIVSDYVGAKVMTHV
jgi:SAM-dependent methyltransferase